MVTDVEGANNTWSGWTSLGGTWVNDPTALGASGGTVWVFAVDLTSAVYNDNLATSGTWTGWVNVGGTFGGVPSFTEDASGNFHLADVTLSGTLEANKIDGGLDNHRHLSRRKLTPDAGRRRSRPAVLKRRLPASVPSTWSAGYSRTPGPCTP
jgi:hypothetical protein